MKKRVLLLLSCLFISIGFIVAQTTQVTGVVIDDAGEPAIGATVVVKGTTIGTITDADGKFSLNVTGEGKTLVFTLLGMKKVEALAQPNMRIVMEADEATQLDEVMVVAYGTAKKSAFTGSATVVKAEDIGKIQATNPVTALTGRSSGIQIFTASGQPGIAETKIRIRGTSSIRAENEPLIILDGIPYDGSLNTINNQDIESMTVLKDAASSALYGARGATGVIIITTKKGKLGQARVTVDAKWGSNSRATQDYKLVNNPALYYEMYYGALNNYAQNTLGKSAASAHVWTNENMLKGGDYGLGYNVYNIPDGQTLIGTNGKLNPNATLGNRVTTADGNVYTLTPDNWTDEAFRNALRQEYNVSVTAATDKSSFYTSVNYLSNDGITQNSDYERVSAMLKADYQVKPWLKIGANMTYGHFKYNQLGNDGESNSSGNVFAIANQVAPIYPLYARDENGNKMTDIYGNTVYDFGDAKTAVYNRPVFPGSNALAESILNTYGANGNTVNATVFAEIRFLNDFKFTTTNNAYVYERRRSSITNPYYGLTASSKGFVSKEHYRNFSTNFQQMLSYAKTINGIHNLDAIFVHEAYKQEAVILSASRKNMFNPQNPELAGAVEDNSMNSYSNEYNTEGYIFRAQYNYDNKYFISGSFRRDGSSRFHKDNRWGNFWSLGGAWNMQDEAFLKLPSWIDLLKFKASYGEVGNDAIGNNRYTNTFSVVVSDGNAAVVPLAKGNKNITWESKNSFNTGFDFGLFKNRLNGTIEYYHSKTTDMLAWFTLPLSYGYGGYYSNIGDMTNKGVEIELFGTPIETRDFSLDLRFNVTFYDSKITYLADETKQAVTKEGVRGYASSYYFYGEGIDFNTFYMKEYAGVNEKGEALYYKTVKDKDGKTTRETTTRYSDGDRYLQGSPNPDAYGGFGLSSKYKGFDFSMDFVYQIGGQVLDLDYFSTMGSPTAKGKGSAFHADLLNSWSPDNTGSNIPRFQFGDTNDSSNRWLTDASYIGIQNINAGYTLPKNLCQKLDIDKIRIYLACDNVALWSKRQGLDPRQSVDGEITGSYYAPIRTISGGISVTF